MLADDSQDAIAARLREYREAKSYSQAAMAAACGLNSQQAYQHYETGKRFLPAEVALDLCRNEGLTMDWIYRGVPDMLPLHVAQILPSVAARLERPAKASV
ncbi:helix-turn-helix transcriptional regulator [Methylobacterium sp. Gmos1]